MPPTTIPRLTLLYLLRPSPRRLTLRPAIRNASTRAPETDKSRILEKPTRFNPPSHGSRRVRPRQYPGPRLSEEEVERMKTKRYPNMMPPEGSFMWWFLTERRLHLWITLGTLTTLAIYAWTLSFLHTTAYRAQLPAVSDLFSRPFATISQFVQVYKLHVTHESEVVAQKRRRKLDDVGKRQEFLREHGVEPGFLTGSWLDRFGTVEGDEKKEREKVEAEGGQGVEGGVVEGSPVSEVALGVDRAVGREVVDVRQAGEEMQQEPREKKKVKMWLGIW